jgi:hypothetical protein
MRSSLELVMRAHGMLQPDTAVTIQVDARRQVMTTLAKLTEDELRAIATGKPMSELVDEIGAPLRDAKALNPA